MLGPVHRHGSRLFESGGPLDDRTQSAPRRPPDAVPNLGDTPAALSYIPGALVNVTVDLDDVRREVERQAVRRRQAVRSRSNPRSPAGPAPPTRRSPAARNPAWPATQPASVAAAAAGPLTQQDGTNRRTPTSASPPVGRRPNANCGPPCRRPFRVAVSIPEDYHEAVAADRGLSPGDDDATRGRCTVQAVDAIRLDGGKAGAGDASPRCCPLGSPPTAVHVTTVTPVTPEVPDRRSCRGRTASARLASRWGRPWPCASLAAAGLLVLRRGMKLPEPRRPPRTLAGRPPGAGKTDRQGGVSPAASGRTGPKCPTRTPPPKTPRDRVAALAVEDPDAVAAVVGAGSATPPDSPARPAWASHDSSPTLAYFSRVMSAIHLRTPAKRPCCCSPWRQGGGAEGPWPCSPSGRWRRSAPRSPCVEEVTAESAEAVLSEFEQRHAARVKVERGGLVGVEELLTGEPRRRRRPGGGGVDLRQKHGQRPVLVPAKSRGG